MVEYLHMGNQTVTQRPMRTKSGRIFEILVVEDNPGDVRLLQETLRDSPHEVKFTVAEDGEAAMDTLRGDEDSFTPDLILLDLNLPKEGGREVLSEIKNDPALSRIPVIVLTSSQADKDRQRPNVLRAAPRRRLLQQAS